jgi:hypothetical protein
MVPQTCGGLVEVWIDGKLVLNTTAGPGGFYIPDNWFIGFSASNSAEHYGAVYVDNITLVVPKTSEANNPERLAALAQSDWIKSNGYYIVYITKKDFYSMAPWERQGATQPNLQLWGVLLDGTFRAPGTVTIPGSPTNIGGTEWSWLQVTPSSNVSIPSLDLPGIPLYNLFNNKYAAISSAAMRIALIDQLTTNLLAANNVTVALSELDLNSSNTEYAGWEGAHVAKWIQYGYSHGEKWTSIWWDQSGPASFYSPWMRMRAGVTMYESGDILFQYDRADFLFPGGNITALTGLDSFESSLSSANLEAKVQILSTLKSTTSIANPATGTKQQVGIFSDVWSGMDMFDIPRKPGTPDDKIKWANLDIGNLTVSYAADYGINNGGMSVALSTSKDILVQYQGNLFTVAGSPECVNCNTPAIQPPPSPQPATVAQVPPDCYCVCGLQTQPSNVTGNATSINLGILSVACDMVLYGK